MANYKIRLKDIILFIISRVYGFISLLLSPFISIDDKSVLFWSWNSRQFSCNPKALSDYLAHNHKEEFNIYWSFKGDFPTSLDSRIIPLKWGSLKYLLTALSCKFLVSNTRNAIETMLFFKRKQQIYIMTWHAGMSLKKIERDSINSLSAKYIRRCKKDSKMCNLMVSGSKFQTKLFNNSFWYDGEILNCGTPRNDILFSQSNTLRNNICKKFSIVETSIIVLYAPTFRTVFNPDIISFDWARIKKAIELKFHDNVVLLVRLHPNIRNKVKLLRFDFNGSNCIDVTQYHDIQELLVASDILITDYSSSMFDFSLMKKPCFLLVKDRIEYDRGFYIPLSQLPFDLAECDKDLENQILSFDESTYINKINDFNINQIGSFERGRACKALYSWMSLKQSNHRHSNHS